MNVLTWMALGSALLGVSFACDVEEGDEFRQYELVEVSELGPASEEQPAAVEDGLVSVTYEDEEMLLVAGCSASAGACTCFGDSSCGAWTDDDGHEHALCYDDAEKTEGTTCFAGANGGDCACSPIKKKVKGLGGI